VIEDVKTSSAPAADGGGPPEKQPKQRRSPRSPCDRILVLENLAGGEELDGRMTNFSRDGLYFESNIAVKPGRVIFIGIANSPYTSEPDTYECHRVKVQWRKDLAGGEFKYGYGVSHMDPIGARPTFTEKYYYDMPKYLGLILKEISDARKYSRKPLARPVYFTTTGHYSSGKIRNISRNGLFIEAHERVPKGRVVYLAIPGTRFDQKWLIKAQVAYRQKNGFGVQFLGVAARKAAPGTATAGIAEKT
jgi:hypothetical protein